LKKFLNPLFSKGMEVMELKPLAIEKAFLSKKQQRLN